MEDSARLRRAVGRLLSAGVAASALLLAWGVLAALRGGPGAGDAPLRAGLSILIATPVLRIALLGAGYALGRDWRFAGVCLALLAMIAASVLLGFLR